MEILKCFKKPLLNAVFQCFVTAAVVFPYKEHCAA